MKDGWDASSDLVTRQADEGWRDGVMRRRSVPTGVSSVFSLFYAVGVDEGPEFIEMLRREVPRRFLCG